MNCPYCFDQNCDGVGPCPKNEMDDDADDFLGPSEDVMSALGLVVNRNWGCNDPKCSASTGICESMTFGNGRLSHNGYWEFPCAECARAWETMYPNDGACWPFPEEKVN